MSKHLARIWTRLFLEEWEKSKEEPTERFKKLILKIVYREVDRWQYSDGDMYGDTISHALITALKYRNKFNPDRGKPYAYFAIIIRQSIISYHYNSVSKSIDIVRKTKVGAI